MAEQVKEKIEDIKDATSDLLDHVKDIGDTYYKLAAITVTEKATNIASGIVGIAILGTLGMLVLLFGSITLALWLGDLIESRTGGFAIVAGFFLLVTIILLAIRKKIIFPYFRNLLIRKSYD
jgi:hypothetical protein